MRLGCADLFGSVNEKSMGFGEVMRELVSVWRELHHFRADECEDFDSFVCGLTAARIDEMICIASVNEPANFNTSKHPLTWHM